MGFINPTLLGNCLKRLTFEGGEQNQDCVRWQNDYMSKVLTPTVGYWYPL